MVEPRSLDWLPLDMPAARAIAARDWSMTPLGAIATWPAALRATLCMLVAHPLPMALIWGAARLTLHNDAYRTLLGGKADPLGRPFLEVWPEAHDIIAPQIDRAFAGETVSLENAPFLLQRPERDQESWFDYSFSPIRDGAGAVVGVLNTGVETTERVLAERRRAAADVALRESETQYRLMFEAMEEGYLLADVIFDDAGEAIGVEWLNANPAAARMSGSGSSAGGLCGIAPWQEHWSGVFGRVATTGEAEHLEHCAELDGIWYDFHVFKVSPHDPGSRRVGVMFIDATRRRAAEELLRSSEERQAFLLALSDRLRQTGTAAESMKVAAELFARRLGLALAHFRIFEDDQEHFDVVAGFDDGRLPVAVTARPGRIADYGPGWGDQFRRGEAIFSDDHDERPPEDAAIARTLGIWSGSAVPLIRDGRLVAIFSTAHWAPRRWTEEEKRLQRETAERTWAAVERARAEQARRASELRLRVLIEGIPQLVWRAVDHGLWTWASPQWTAYTGQTSDGSCGWNWLDPVHPDDRQAARDAWSRSHDTGEFHADYRIRDLRTGRYHWFQTRAEPVFDDAGQLREWLGTSTDVQDLREFQERQRVLVAELQHRTRNLMAVIVSIADKTARSSADLGDFSTRFRDRLDALARVQGLLSRLGEHDRVRFDELVHTELSAMAGDSDRVRVEGPANVRLRSSTVQTLALVLHELMTNALKHGALSQRDGRLAISWRLEPKGEGGSPWLGIDWRESNVVMPPDDPTPLRRGQGRELIERALPYQLGAETSYALQRDGVHCRIAIPVSATEEAAHG